MKKPSKKTDTFLKLTSFFPEKVIKIHEEDKPFIIGRIKQLIYQRDKLYQRGKVEEAKTKRNQIVYEIRKEKKKFYDEKIRTTHSPNPKK